ncbi:DUF7344 domain-containing protein [Haladaptatus sp. NG-WS-4]
MPSSTSEVNHDLSKEDVFTALGNERRRYAVHYLLRDEGDVEIGDLAVQIAAWENGKGVEDITPQERRRVYNALQQVHLPKMDEVGIIQFDADRGVVSVSDDLTDLRVYLEIVPGHEIPWSQYYLLLGVFSASVTLAAWLSVPPFGRLNPLLLAGVVSGLFVASAVVHAYHGRNMRLGDAERPPSV